MSQKKPDPSPSTAENDKPPQPQAESNPPSTEQEPKNPSVKRDESEGNRRQSMADNDDTRDLYPEPGTGSRRGDMDSNPRESRHQRASSGRHDSSGGSEQSPDRVNGFANSMCHDMDTSDMLVAVVCPCITYGQILENLDPLKDNGHGEESGGVFSTGCYTWTGLLAASALAIQIPLLIPGTCAWMPTMQLGGVVDARELFLIGSYFVPHLLCHCPLRMAALERDGENPCTTCADSILCSCCSLASLKAMSAEGNTKFKMTDDSLGKIVPCLATLESRNESEGHGTAMRSSMMRSPRQTNRMTDSRRSSMRRSGGSADEEEEEDEDGREERGKRSMKTGSYIFNNNSLYFLADTAQQASDNSYKPRPSSKYYDY